MATATAPKVNKKLTVQLDEVGGRILRDDHLRKKTISFGKGARPKHVVMGDGFSIISADFVLADGTKMKGFVEICTADGGEHYGSAFYLPWSNGLAEQDEDNFLPKMRKSKEEVFPYSYRYHGWESSYDHHLNEQGWSN